MTRSRGKEKFFLTVFKVICRKSLGVLLLVVVSVAVCSSVLYEICKDDAPPAAKTTFMGNSFKFLIKPQSNLDDQDKDSSSIPRAGKIQTGHQFSACPVRYLPVEQAITKMPSVPSASPVLVNLTYVYEQNPVGTESFGGSEFGGYQSLQQRNESFDIKESMSVHCGFVRGCDIEDANRFELEQCQGIVVASAIFGNHDILKQPKNVSEAVKENICFLMFVDEETEAYLRNSSAFDERNKAGLWKVVVIHNLPCTDPRRNARELVIDACFDTGSYGGRDYEFCKKNYLQAKG